MKEILAVMKQLTKAVVKKAQKKVFNGIRTHELRDTGAMLYQLSYEASLYKYKIYVIYTS